MSESKVERSTPRIVIGTSPAITTPPIPIIVPSLPIIVSPIISSTVKEESKKDFCSCDLSGMQTIVNDITGQCFLFKGWLNKENADMYLNYCRSLQTKKYDFRFRGYPLKDKRENRACGDPGVYHSFGGVDVEIHEWCPMLKHLRDLIHKHHKVYTNFCLQNTYRNGQDSIAPHSDGELYADNNSVFTLSLGTTRIMDLIIKTPVGPFSSRNEFLFSKTDYTKNIRLKLEHGDLLLFCGNFQSGWKHGIQKDPTVTTERHSLTFRGAKTR